MSSSAFTLLHRGVQEAIWKMGWKEFHPIQVDAIHRILESNDHLVITAQTAGGKTEAAFLPIISAIASNPLPSIQALYVGPLKALINDQFQRLERLCEALEIPVHRWHGDVSASKKRHLRDDPSGILLITPESLESNFINYGLQVPRIYQHLQFVVIDELHSFLDNVRGIHLRSLLSRLCICSKSNPRILGLSATLADFNIARRFVCPDEPERVWQVNDPNSTREIRLGIKAYLKRPIGENERTIEPRVSPSLALAVVRKIDSQTLLQNQSIHKGTAPELAPVLTQGLHGQDSFPVDEEVEEIAEDILRHFSTSTNLIFVNDKGTIETLADKLHGLALREKVRDPFVVHHGSLSKEIRQKAEEQLKGSEATTAICSSTLEMGIDIGAVRAVGQVDPPYSVASMVQRLGRSGRREGEAAIMRMYIREVTPHFGSELTDLLFPRLLRAIATTRLMLVKWLEPPQLDRLHLSTLVHQTLSCLKQTGGMAAPLLGRVMIEKGPFRNVDKQRFAAVLRALGKAELIEQIPTGELILAPAGERITASMDFYAAFQSTDEFTIRYAETEIGKLPAQLIPPVGELLILAGRRWKVESIEPEELTVFVVPTRGGRPPKFLGSGWELHPRVAQEMFTVLCSHDEPQWVDEEGRCLLRAARHVAREVRLTSTGVLFKPGGIQWFPWNGSCCLETLSLLAISQNISHVLDPHHLSITYNFKGMADFYAHLKWVTGTKVSVTELAALQSRKTEEKFDRFLTEDLINYAYGRDWLDLELAQTTAEHVLSNRETLSSI